MAVDERSLQISRYSARNGFVGMSVLLLLVAVRELVVGGGLTVETLGPVLAVLLSGQVLFWGSHLYYRRAM